MFYVKNNQTDPRYNLALEEFLLKDESIQEPILLLWQNSPTVVIGLYQNTLEEINSDFVRENNVNVVRRITGGGAVYHDLGNLNYSFIAMGVDEEINFKKFTKPLLEALKYMGINAELTGRNDLLVDGKKFSGNAQYYYQHRLLHHGTILYDSNLEDVQKALKVKPGKIESKGIKSVRGRVTNLKPYISEDMTVTEFKQYLLNYFIKTYGIKEYVLSEEDSKAVENLVKTKYLTWDWTYASSPNCNVTRGAFFKCGYIEFRFQVEHNVICETYVNGDFFSLCDMKEFLDKFKGIRYERESIEQFLNSVELTKYFGEITAEEIVNVIC
ncbi:MAG: lipoate--protein ligase [Clostridium sp.]|nr:lipoate--protein ligase [Clostridium sp.]